MTEILGRMRRVDKPVRVRTIDGLEMPHRQLQQQLTDRTQTPTAQRSRRLDLPLADCRQPL